MAIPRILAIAAVMSLPATSFADTKPLNSTQVKAAVRAAKQTNVVEKQAVEEDSDLARNTSGTTSSIPSGKKNKIRNGFQLSRFKANCSTCVNADGRAERNPGLGGSSRPSGMFSNGGGASGSSRHPATSQQENPE